MRGIFIHILFTITLIIILPFIVFSSHTKKEDNKIKVFIKDKVVLMDLEEYVKCVVASEMPVKFHEEALKAQAVASRTFAYKKIFNSSLNSNKI